MEQLSTQQHLLTNSYYLQTRVSNKDVLRSLNYQKLSPDKSQS